MRSYTRFGRSVISVLAVIAALVVVPATAAGATVSASAEQDFVNRLNGARSAAGLPPLAVAGDLVTNARTHSHWMGTNNTLAHNPNLSKQITNWVQLGENVGYGGSVSTIHNALMNSPGHRANILHTGYNQVGIGTWVSSSGRIWVTQVFRKTATAAAPTPAPQTAIDAKYASLGGSRGVLGLPTTAEHKLWGGAYRAYQVGSIYWTASTGAHEIRGDIRGTWARLGWERSKLGWPVTDELGTPDGRGRFNAFQAGSIYWTPWTGAHEVRGAIRQTWGRLGWERSALGYPRTDELGAPDGVGRYNHFERGSVYWTPGTGAHEVRGAIRDRWAGMGWERSRLGYPVSDEYAVPGGRRSDFKKGSIVWDARTGATIVL